MTLRTLIAAAACVAVAPAMAQVLPGDAGWDAPAETLLLGGATATNGAIRAQFELKETAGGICQDGTVVLLADDGDDGDDVFAYSCNLNASGAGLFPALSTGDLIRVQKNNIGGSAQGCAPVSFQDDQQFIPITNNPNNGCDAPVTIPGGGDDQDLIVFRNCPITDLQPADGGFSDIECGLLGCGADCQGNLTTSPGFQVLFGIPVSLNIYRGLQVCQGITTLDDDAANAPNLPQAVIASMFSGNLVDWTDVHCDPEQDGVDIFDMTEAVTRAGFPALARTEINIQRRVETSGTQTYTEIWALRENCTGQVPSFVTSNTPGNTCQGGTSTDCEAQIDAGTVGRVCCNSGSGNVRGALDRCTANNLGCVGVASMDSLDNFFQGQQARFTKVDGAFPSLCNAANGVYDFVSLNSAQTFTGSAGNALIGFVGLLPSVATVQTANAGINDDVFGPTGEYTGFIADPITGLFGGFGPVGNPCFAPDPNNPDPRDGGPNDVVENPVSAYTRAALGGPNNCSSYTAVTLIPGVGIDLSQTAE